MGLIADAVRAVAGSEIDHCWPAFIGAAYPAPLGDAMSRNTWPADSSDEPVMGRCVFMPTDAEVRYLVILTHANREVTLP